MNAFNRVLGFLIGLSVAAAAVVLTVEFILLALTETAWLIDRSTWDRSLSSLQWNDQPRTILLLVVLGFVGLLLLVLELRPSPPAWYRLAVGDEHRRVMLARSGLEEQLRQSALADNEVVAARASAGRRRVRVAVQTTPRAIPSEVQPRLRVFTVASLDRLQLERPLRAHLEVRRQKDRVT